MCNHCDRGIDRANPADMIDIALECTTETRRRIMALEQELEVYKSKLPELASDEGKFVLIHAGAVVSVYTSYEDAIQEGYSRFRLEPFLVKQIHATEQVQFISRLSPLATCLTSPGR